MNISPQQTLLIQQLKQAWKQVPYPGDENISTPYSYDDEGITVYFSGTTWAGHNVEDLRAHCSAISSYFTPTAYHYWLSSYLIAAIEQPAALSQGIDSLITSITPVGGSSRRSSEQKKRLALLTNEQKRAMIQAIAYVVRDGCYYPEWIADEKVALCVLNATVNAV